MNEKERVALKLLREREDFDVLRADKVNATVVMTSNANNKMMHTAYYNKILPLPSFVEQWLY